MPRDSWADVVTVFTVLAPPEPCPHCGSLERVIIRTEQNGDGSLTRKCVCKLCSQRFKYSAEPIANAGNGDTFTP